MMSRTRQTDRRPVRLETIDDLLEEVDRIVEAERAGALRRTGNWSVGQTLGHLAAWIEYAYVGYPAEMRVPWFVRVIVRLMKRRFLTRPMPPGVRITRGVAGTFGVEEMSAEEGARRLREAAGRLKRGEPAQHDSPALGPLSVEERTALNLRHAELHLGYLIPNE